MNSVLLLTEEETILLTGVINRWMTNNHRLAAGQQLIVSLDVSNSPDAQSPTVNLMQYHTEFDAKLAQSVDELDLGGIPGSFAKRLENAFANAGIRTKGELVRLTERRVFGWRNFGKMSLKFLRDVLDKDGLALGLRLPIGPRERAVYDRRPFNEYWWPQQVVLCVQGCGINTYGELRRMSLRTRSNLHKTLAALKPEEAPSGPSRLNCFLREHSNADARLLRLIDYATNLDLFC